MTTETVVGTQLPFSVTIADRCDRCGAQAYARAQFRDTKAELLFCAHHYAKYADALARQALAVQDLRYLLREEK